MRSTTRRSPRQIVHDLRLTGPERAAARSERLAEDAMRRERDNQETADRRAAAVEAERRRYDHRTYGGGR
jgi:hypothetical protein